MSKGIDYSKWDHVDYGSSSDDEDNDEIPGQQPRVTRLDTPSRVTRSPTGALSIISSPSNDPPIDRVPNHPNEKSSGASSIKNTPLLTSNPVVPPTTEPPSHSSNVSHSSTTPIPAEWTRNGGNFPWEKGNDCSVMVYWCQDRMDVVVRMIVATTATTTTTIRPRDIRVNVTGVLPYSERCTAVGGHDTPSILSVTLDPLGSFVLQGTLPHSVYLTPEEEELNHEDDKTTTTVDWQVSSLASSSQTKSNILVEMTLHKAVPMVGIHHWWNCPFLEAPERIDVTQIADRGTTTNDATTTAMPDMKSTWQQAHDMFIQNRREEQNQTEDNRTPI